MRISLPRLAAQLTAGVLLAFSLRRALLLGAALWPARGDNKEISRVGDLVAKSPTRDSYVIVLAACRNEAASLPGLLQALDELDYPREYLKAVIIDDGSRDETARLATHWAATRPWARVLSLANSVGKAEALNQALLAHVPAGHAEAGVVIYDADHRPAPASLRRLANALHDPAVGAASGMMRVANGHASPAAYYAHLESLVHQGITMRAKDRLRLAPALLGANCIYRLAALRALGGFRAGALLEDSDLTLALARAGWQTRFVPEAVSEHHAPVTLGGYIRQHLRWNRGFQQAGRTRLPEVWGDKGLSWPLKLELTFFALGYADRLALLAAGACTLGDLAQPGTFRFPALAWLAYFGVPGLEMLAALRLARQAPAMFARLVYVPFFFAADLGVAVWSAVQGAARQPLVWGPTERG